MQCVAITISFLALATTARASNDLWFSEYVEGSSNNKALEIYNNTGADVDLSTYKVSMFFNGSSSAGLTINLVGTVVNGGVFVLAQNAADPAILAVANQTAGGGWFNGDDAIALIHGTTTIDVIGQIGFDPGSEWGSGLQSTQDNTLRRKTSVTDGDANGADAFDPSIEWDGFPINTFDGLGHYPDGGATPRTIPEIQGAGHVSPHVGELVETTGIVTAVDSNGFFLQDPVGDGDSNTSDGIFVFTSSAPTVVVGDQAKVTGSVAEFQPGGPSTSNLTSTEIDGPTITVLSSGNPLPAPVVLGAAGLLPPTEIIDDDDFALFDPASDGIDFYEALEGMLVQVNGALAVSAKNEFGEIFTVTDGGAHTTRINSRSGITLSASDFNPERIQVQIDAMLTPGFDPAVVVGDSLGDVVGVVGYSFGNFEVLATQTFTVTPGGLQPETTNLSPPDDVLTVATFNCLNLDPNVEDISLVNSATDIDDDIGSGRFDALAAEIVNALHAPDVIALQEIQDNDGAELTSVTDASLTYTTLIAAIDAAGGPHYDFCDVPPVNGTSGGQPGGNIRVGYLFNAARVFFDAPSLQSLSDPDLTDGDAFQDSRRPLVAKFEFQGRVVTLVNNHLSSKGGSTPLFGLVQPPINGSEDRRNAQAAVVHDFVQGLLQVDPAANGIVLGDLNEFSYEQPLLTLKGAGTPILTDLSDLIPDLERYTYVFDGNSQDLDHVFATPNLAAIATYDPVHMNAEFPHLASDHDPIVTTYTFPEICQPDLGFGGPGTATLAVCGDPLRPTGVATLLASGLPAGTTGILVYSLTNASTPFVGGTLVPAFDFFLLETDVDNDGEISMTVPGSASDVPLSVFIQFVYLNSPTPPKFEFTNAVEIQLLGR